MNFQQLEYIIAVHHHQHFAKAAESCNITQATLSIMIKKLEDELDIKLFDRTKYPIKTTERGEKVILTAQKILSLKNELYTLAQNTPTTLSGHLRLGIIPTIANPLLSLVLPEILSSFPELQIEIAEIPTQEIIRQLKSDQLDLGILATPLQEELLEEHILYYEAMVVYGVKNKNKKYIATEEVQNTKIWLLEEGNCFRTQSATICNIKEKKIHPENLHFEAGTLETLLQLSDTFGGYTLLPELYSQRLKQEQKEKVRHFEKPIPVREVSIVSYRPHAKINSIQLLSEKIRAIINPLLTSSSLRPKDVEIIGV